MNKAELVEKLAARTRISLREARDMVDAIFDPNPAVGLIACQRAPRLVTSCRNARPYRVEVGRPSGRLAEARRRERSRPSGRGNLRWDVQPDGLSRKGVAANRWAQKAEPQERLRDGTGPHGFGRSKPLRA